MAGRSDIPIPILIAIIVVSASLLALDRVVLRPFPSDAKRIDQLELAYPGDGAITVLQPGTDGPARSRAETALQDASFHAAYAEGPANRSGVWTGAHDPALARQYALAACGQDCRVVAERWPLHAPEQPTAGRLVLLPDMARRLGERWPFVSSGDVLAIGGAGAWGTGHAGGRSKWRTAVRRAIAECDARLAAEQAPDGITPAPCRYMSLREIEIADLRPKTSLYPAPYTIALTRLTPVAQDRLQLMRADGDPMPGANRFRHPDELYGARATNGDGASGVIRGAGWPEAASDLALQLCEAGRRFGAPPCKLVTRRLPAQPLPDDSLAVTPELMDAYRAWQKTGGAGAFAISALGMWGFSYGATSLDAARQKAADWCAYYARRGNRPYTLRRAYIDQPPCRIVAERKG